MIEERMQIAIIEKNIPVEEQEYYKKGYEDGFNAFLNQKEFSIFEILKITKTSIIKIAVVILLFCLIKCCCFGSSETFQFTKNTSILDRVDEYSAYKKTNVTEWRKEQILKNCQGRLESEQNNIIKKYIDEVAK